MSRAAAYRSAMLVSAIAGLRKSKRRPKSMAVTLLGGNDQFRPSDRRWRGLGTTRPTDHVGIWGPVRSTTIRFVAGQSCVGAAGLGAVRPGDDRGPRAICPQRASRLSPTGASSTRPPAGNWGRCGLQLVDLSGVAVVTAGDGFQATAFWGMPLSAGTSVGFGVAAPERWPSTPRRRGACGLRIRWLGGFAGSTDR